MDKDHNRFNELWRSIKFKIPDIKIVAGKKVNYEGYGTIVHSARN